MEYKYPKFLYINEFLIINVVREFLVIALAHGASLFEQFTFLSMLTKNNVVLRNNHHTNVVFC